MPFQHTTQCISYADFKRLGIKPQAVWPLITNGFERAFRYGGIAALSVLVIGPGAVPIVWSAFSYGFIDGFCDQWLNRRLICIQHDQCAIGRIAWIEEAGHKFFEGNIDWWFDNDTTFNLQMLPYTGRIQDEHKTWRYQFSPTSQEVYGIDRIVADRGPASTLLQKPFADLGYQGFGEGDEKPPDHPGGRWTLHCEIEGNGMKTLCTIAKALALLAPLSQILGPIAGMIVGAIAGAVLAFNLVHDWIKRWCKIPILCEILALLAGVIAAVVGFIIGAFVGFILGWIPGVGQLFTGALLSIIIRHNGSFDDAENPASRTIEEDDCIFVLGDHVYDAGHPEGWVELHPVKHLQKICGVHDDIDPNGDTCCPGMDVNDPMFHAEEFQKKIRDYWETWCNMCQQGYSSDVRQAQQKLENRWCLHPLIDGCRPNPRTHVEK